MSESTWYLYVRGWMHVRVNVVHCAHGWPFKLLVIVYSMDFHIDCIFCVSFTSIRSYSKRPKISMLSEISYFLAQLHLHKYTHTRARAHTYIHNYAKTRNGQMLLHKRLGGKPHAYIVISSRTTRRNICEVVKLKRVYYFSMPDMTLKDHYVLATRL